jgi:hypothetical protein
MSEDAKPTNNTTGNKVGAVIGCSLLLLLVTNIVSVYVSHKIGCYEATCTANSYFSTAVKTITSETVAALESGEPGFLERIRKLDAALKSRQYENNQGLREKAERFRDEGEAIRLKRQLAVESR